MIMKGILGDPKKTCRCTALLSKAKSRYRADRRSKARSRFSSSALGCGDFGLPTPNAAKRQTLNAKRSRAL
jgi:hypothetical protein